MWLSIALALTVLGAVITALGLFEGQRGGDRTTVLFVGGISLFGAGTLLLGIALLVG